jgi:hypothetical protein
MPNEAKAFCLVEKLDMRKGISIGDGDVTGETGSGDISTRW